MLSQHFKAKIYKLGAYPCVDVPPEVSAVFTKRGYVPVVCQLNGHTFQASLTPKGGGQHRLFLNGEVRKLTRVAAGDTIEVSLVIDTASREQTLPDDLAEALRENDLLEAFQHWQPSKRRLLLAWIKEAKSEETRLRRAERMVQYLIEDLPRIKRQMMKSKERDL